MSITELSATSSGFLAPRPATGGASRTESFNDALRGAVSVPGVPSPLSGELPPADQQVRAGMSRALTTPSYGTFDAGNPWRGYREQIPDQVPDTQAGDQW